MVSAAVMEPIAAESVPGMLNAPFLMSNRSYVEVRHGVLWVDRQPGEEKLAITNIVAARHHPLKNHLALFLREGLIVILSVERDEVVRDLVDVQLRCDTSQPIVWDDFTLRFTNQDGLVVFLGKQGGNGLCWVEL